MIIIKRVFFSLQQISYKLKNMVCQTDLSILAFSKIAQYCNVLFTLINFGSFICYDNLDFEPTM